MRRGVIVRRAGDGDILLDYRVALFLELLAEHLFERLEADAHHAQAGGDGQGILLELVAAVLAELGHRKRTEADPGSWRAGLDGVTVVDYGRAVAQ